MLSPRLHIEIGGDSFPLYPHAITWDTGGKSLKDVFHINETIKVYCLRSKSTPSYEVEKMAPWIWSIKALEPFPGALIKDKAKVFAEAEQSAKEYKARRADKEMMREKLCESYDCGLWARNSTKKCFKRARVAELVFACVCLSMHFIKVGQA